MGIFSKWFWFMSTTQIINVCQHSIASFFNLKWYAVRADLNAFLLLLSRLTMMAKQCTLYIHTHTHCTIYCASNLIHIKVNKTVNDTETQRHRDTSKHIRANSLERCSDVPHVHWACFITRVPVKKSNIRTYCLNNHTCLVFTRAHTGRERCPN